MRTRRRYHLQDHGWTWPVVLKPDVGQRGAGVLIVRDEDDAGEYLGSMTAAVVAQPYHPGPYEAGVFYYRKPEWRSGRILSITDKHFPVVVGDGRSTLPDLVWGHRRYRMQERMFLQRLGARAQHVPAAGERVAIGLAGNHAQRAMFTDGRHLLTPAPRDAHRRDCARLRRVLHRPVRHPVMRTRSWPGRTWRSSS